MKILLRIVFVAGFCLATIGAAGFAHEREPAAAPLLAAGLGLVLLTAITTRLRRDHGGAGPGGGRNRSQLAERLAAITHEARAIEAAGPGLQAPALVERLDALLSGPCAEVGADNEEWARLLGLAEYTRIWDGFATGERLLARAWSMSADGHAGEARDLLPRIRAQFERAAAAARA